MWGVFAGAHTWKCAQQPPGEREEIKPEASKEMMQLGAQSLLGPSLRELLLFGLGWFCVSSAIPAAGIPQGPQVSVGFQL